MLYMDPDLMLTSEETKQYWGKFAINALTVQPVTATSVTVSMPFATGLQATSLDLNYAIVHMMATVRDELSSHYSISPAAVRVVRQRESD